MTGNIWLDGVMGVVIGDALGCPVQFIDRAERKFDSLPTELLKFCGQSC